MKIGVLLPVYKLDTLELFKEAFLSVIQQKISPFDVLICIDGNISKELMEYINQITIKYSNVKTIISNKNIGLAAILNKGIQETDYELYFRMDADDISLPDRFALQLAEINKDKTLLLVGTHHIRLDQMGNRYPGRKLPLSLAEMKRTVLKRCPMVHATVAYKKELFYKIGYYNEKLIGGMEDYDLFARAVIAGINMQNIKNQLYIFRANDDLKSRRITWKNIYNDYKISINIMTKLRQYSMIFVLILKIFSKIIFKISPTILYTYSKKYIIK